MGRYRKQEREFKEAINELKENSQAIAENTSQTNEKLDDIKEATDVLRKNTTSKIPVYSLIVAIVGVIIPFSGVTLGKIYDRMISGAESEVETAEIEAIEKTVVEESKYEIYLYPEYSTINIGTNVDMTASVNFETDAVNITGYLASGKEVTIPLKRKNATEWKNKVSFIELGVHEIVVTATAPNGETVENSIKVEVIPTSIDMDLASQIFTDVFTDLAEDFQTEFSEEQSALTAYSSFLSGDRTLLDDGQSEMWWIPDFHEDGMEYEYTYLDLDGDEIAELLVQMADDPCGYNAVFHFENGKLFCWNSDAMEMSCWDYPLADGTMIRQYDYMGTSTYTIFRYRGNGEIEEISVLFSREELMPEDSLEPCPYYEIDGKEVDKTKFYEQLGRQVKDCMLDRVVWKAI